MKLIKKIELKKEVKKSDFVYLATDPDREGEAIAWHLKEVLGGHDDKYLRVKYPEITKAAIHKAFENPGRVNMNLVNAQQARRILDRLVGYKLSPFVSQKIRRGLSAGRVQSVAVRMIVDRENEIRAFVPKEYWSIEALLEKDGIQVRIIEKDPQRCRVLAEQLPNADIIQGDFTSRGELEENGLSACDAFLSLAGLDEVNMITSLYASSQGVGQVITKLDRPGNSLLAGELDLGSIICPRELCCNDIVRYVRAMGNQTGAAISVHSIAEGEAEAVEFLVDDSVRNCGVPLKELKLRPNMLLASISRRGSVEIPSGDSCIRVGDNVVVVTTTRGCLKTLNDIFA